jgi:hypothetical protein
MDSQLSCRYATNDAGILSHSKNGDEAFMCCVVDSYNNGEYTPGKQRWHNAVEHHYLICSAVFKMNLVIS